MIAIQPLPGLFGADVHGIDLRHRLTEGTILSLAEALVEHKVLRIRGQALTTADYARFGSHFGDPIFFAALSDRDTQFPQLIHIANSPTLPAYQHNGAAFWHTDGTYDKVPVSTTMLYAVEAPDDGGETLFADLVEAYDALSQDMRDRIEGLNILHRMSGGKRFDYEKQVSDEGVAYGSTMIEKRGVQVVRHPMVLAHPVTGRKALYGIAGTSFGVEGMAAQEGEALLTHLKQFATQDRFQIAIKAHSGDLLMWDCLSSIHSAVPIDYSDAPGRRRVLMRLSVTGLAEPYRHLRPPFAVEPLLSSSQAA